MTECPYTIASEIIDNMGIQGLINININEGDDYFISTICDMMCDIVSDYGADFDEEILEDTTIEDIVCEVVMHSYDDRKEFQELLEVSPEFQEYYEKNS